MSNTGTGEAGQEGHDRASQGCVRHRAVRPGGAGKAGRVLVGSDGARCGGACSGSAGLARRVPAGHRLGQVRPSPARQARLVPVSQGVSRSVDAGGASPSGLRRGLAGLGEARQVRLGETRRGVARRGFAGLGRQGPASLGTARRGSARSARQVGYRRATLGAAQQGAASRGSAGAVSQGIALLGTVSPGAAWSGSAGPVTSRRARVGASRPVPDGLRVARQVSL